MARRPRDPGTGQLDLFLTETEPPPAESPAPRLVIEPPPPANPEPPNPIESDMPPEPPLPPTDPISDLPPPPDDPPEVAADIRAMFLEEEERQRAEETITIREGKPPLVTGIYRKPRIPNQKPLVLPLANPIQRPAPASPAPSARSIPPHERPIPPSRPSDVRPVPPPPSSSKPRAAYPGRFAAIRNYFAGAKLGRNGLLALLGAIVLVALLAWWSGTRGRAVPQGPAAALDAPVSPVDLPPADSPVSPDTPATGQPDAQDISAATVPDVPAVPVPAAPVATASVPAGAPASGLRIPGTTVTLSGDGAWLVRYDAAVFVSANLISKEGMTALKATAAALLKLPDGATVTIYGHTDDIPLPPDASGPYRTNADLAAARAQVVQEHLNVFCKRQSRYVFETATGAPAPYPNDTDTHRRLNRTVTLRIVPTNRTAD